MVRVQITIDADIPVQADDRASALTRLKRVGAEALIRMTSDRLVPVATVVTYGEVLEIDQPTRADVMACTRVEQKSGR
jgi:hypothetical protein